MAIPDIKAKYQAQSNINEDALTAFTTAYPLIAEGNTVFDYYGLEHLIEKLIPANGNVGIHLRWINDDPTVTYYTQQLFEAQIGSIKFQQTTSQVLADSMGVSYYSLPELLRAEIVAADIDGTPISFTNPAPFLSFDPNTTFNNVQLNNPTTAGQLLRITYRSNPYVQVYG